MYRRLGAWSVTIEREAGGGTHVDGLGSHDRYKTARFEVVVRSRVEEIEDVWVWQTRVSGIWRDAMCACG